MWPTPCTTLALPWRAATTASPPRWQGAWSRTRTWLVCPTGCRCASVRRLATTPPRGSPRTLRRSSTTGTEITAENWSGDLDVEAAIDGAVTNAGADRYRRLNGDHLTHVHTASAAADTVWLRCRTSTSDIRIGMAARTTVDGPLTQTSDHHSDRRAAQLLHLPLVQGRTATVDKTVALHTSRDPAISDPLRATVDRVGRAPGFDALLSLHRTAWRLLRRRAALDVGVRPAASFGSTSSMCCRPSPRTPRTWIRGSPSG